MSTELAYQMNYQEWKAHAQKLEQTLKVKDAELAKKDAHIAGLMAMVETLKAEAPNAPSLALTNEVFVEGTRKGQKKTKLRKVYEKAHDAEALKKGITDPLIIRTN